MAGSLIGLQSPVVSRVQSKSRGFAGEGGGQRRGYSVTPTAQALLNSASGQRLTHQADFIVIPLVDRNPTVNLLPPFRSGSSIDSLHQLLDVSDHGPPADIVNLGQREPSGPSNVSRRAKRDREG